MEDRNVKKKKKKRMDSPPPRGSSPPPSLRPFTIPKTGSKELFVTIQKDSHTWKDILININNSLWNPTSIALEIKKIERVQNSIFETEYAAKRKELKEKKCSTAETADSYGFLFFRNIAECKRACSEGIKRGQQKLSTRAGYSIGDRKCGIYLCRCVDILNITPLWESKVDIVMLICKFMKGKIKTVGEQLNSQLEPTPDFDAHTSKQFQRGKKWTHERIYNTSQIYLYEIDLDKYSDDDDAAIYAHRPRQCMPYAIVSLGAKENVEPTIISKTTTVFKQPVKQKQLTETTTNIQNNENNNVDFEALTQQKIQYLWYGMYFNNDISLAQIQIGAYSKEPMKLPIEGSNLCITQKISLAKLEKIFPPKIFRKCPCLTMKAIETVQSRKYLHAEIHPTTVMSDKIEKLHARFLKTKMAGVCTLGAGLKLFILPTSEFTHRLGITSPGYPAILHCLFLKPFTGSNIVSEKGTSFEDFKKTLFSSLRDRLQHNEELKRCAANTAPIPPTKNDFGYSTTQRLKVINAFTTVRKTYGVKPRTNEIPQKQNQQTPSKPVDSVPVAHFPDQRSEEVKLPNVDESQSSLMDISAPLSPPPALPVLTPLSPSQENSSTIPTVTTAAQSTSVTMTATTIPKTTSMTDLLNSPAMQLFKRTQPEMFQKITKKNSQTEESEQTSMDKEKVDFVKETEITEPTNAALEEKPAQEPTDRNVETVVVEEKPTTTPMPLRKAQQNIYVKSAAGALSCLFNLSEETLRKEQEQQERSREDDRQYNSRAYDPRDRVRSHDRDRSRGRDRSYSRDRSRKRDRSYDKDRPRNRDRYHRSRGNRDRSRDRDGRLYERSRYRDDRNGRTRYRDERARDVADGQGYTNVNNNTAASQNDIDKAMNYGDIWRKRMAEVERQYIDRFAPPEVSRDVRRDEEESHESQSQSDGHLVIDTAQSSSAISDDQTIPQHQEERLISPHATAVKTLENIGETYYDEVESPSSRSSFPAKKMLHDLRTEMRRKASTEDKFDKDTFEFQDVSSESDLNHIEESMLLRRNSILDDESTQLSDHYPQQQPRFDSQQLHSDTSNSYQARENNISPKDNSFPTNEQTEPRKEASDASRGSTTQSSGSKNTEQQKQSSATRTWKAGVKRRTEERIRRSDAGSSTDAETEMQVTKRKQKRKSKEKGGGGGEVDEKEKENQKKLNMMETLKNFEIQPEKECQIIWENEIAQKKVEVLLNRLKEQPNTETVTDVRQPREKKGPSLPKQKKKSPDGKKAKLPPPDTKKATIPDDRCETPPLEEILNEKIANPVINYNYAGLFPQVGTMGGFFQLQPAANFTFAPIKNTTVSPEKNVELQKSIDPGIPSALGISPDRPTPKTLKEWGEQLKWPELDDFCMEIITEVKNALE